MDTLFQNNEIYITMDSIEIKGQQYSPLHLKHIVVSKHGTEMKNLIGGVIGLLVGLYITFSLQWTVFGWIVIIIGLAFIGLNYSAVKNGKVTTQITMVFQTTHTGEKKIESILLNDYKQALELRDILKGVGGLPQ